jgi:hypothetical protein
VAVLVRHNRRVVFAGFGANHFERYSCPYEQPGSSPDLPIWAVESPATIADPVSVTDDYKQNEIAADELYTGKWVALNTKVDGIKGGRGSPPLVILGGNAYCFIGAGNQKPLVRLPRGKQVAVRAMTGSRPSMPVPITSRRHSQGISSLSETGV